jgi:hypothetical protein
MTKQRILQTAVPNELRRTVLREAEQRYRNELLDDDERQLLLDRIQRIRRKQASCCTPCTRLWRGWPSPAPPPFISFSSAAPEIALTPLTGPGSLSETSALFYLMRSMLGVLPSLLKR